MVTVYTSICIADIFKNFVNFINEWKIGSIKLSLNFLCNSRFTFIKHDTHLVVGFLLSADIFYSSLLINVKHLYRAIYERFRVLMCMEQSRRMSCLQLLSDVFMWNKSIMNSKENIMAAL